MPRRKEWVGRIPIGSDVDPETGKRKQRFEWVGRFKTKGERDAAVAARKAELETSAAALPTCDEYVTRYLADYAKRNKSSSHVNQRERLKRFSSDFEGRPLDLSRAEIKEWVGGTGRWSKAAKVPRGTVAAVVSLYNYAIDEDDLPIERNPARRLTERTKGRSDEAPPTADEFAALLDATAALGDYAPTARALMGFAAFTLMRPGEIFALEWSDIDFKAMRIQKARRVYRGELDSPKSGEKEIALTPPARDALLTLDRFDGPWVFQSKTGRQLSLPTFSNYWAVIKARAGLDFDFYHATKHYGVHYMWTKLGLEPRVIAAQAGWDIKGVEKLLKVYGHGEVGALDEVDAAFAALNEGDDAAGHSLRAIQGGRA